MRHRTAFTLIELIVVIAITGVLAGLLLAAVQLVRAAAYRTQCQNNLRQIGLALQHYHDTNGAFPPGCQGNDSPQPFMSWMARLLPFVEQQGLYAEALAAFRQAAFFERPPHRQILERAMPLFVCPADGRLNRQAGSLAVGLTSYQGVDGRSLSVFDGILYLDSAVRLADITDGASATLMVGERPPSRDERLGWWYAGWGFGRTGVGDLFLGVRERNITAYRRCPRGPYHFVPGTGDDCDASHFWSRHSGGAHFLFCDGSVRFLAYSADPIMPALATRAGGEPVSPPD